MMALNHPKAAVWQPVGTRAETTPDVAAKADAIALNVINTRDTEVANQMMG